MVLIKFLVINNYTSHMNMRTAGLENWLSRTASVRLSELWYRHPKREMGFGWVTMRYLHIK